MNKREDFLITQALRILDRMDDRITERGGDEDEYGRRELALIRRAKCHLRNARTVDRTVRDVPFDKADDVGSIRYRVHPLDVGFNLIVQGMPVEVDRADDPIRVSYQAADGTRRVMSGPQREVLARLGKLGYTFATP